MAYNLLRPVFLYTAQNMTTSLVSTPVEVKNQDNVGIQLDWTGSPVGTFSVQISSNYQAPTPLEPGITGNWVTLPLSPGIAAVGTPDDAYIDLNQMSCQYVRILYTAASGTGSLNALVVAKGV
jgi:hypothetical protein